MSIFFNRTALIVSVVLLAVSNSTICWGTPVIDVYILAGQSNAVGYNDINTYTPAPFPTSLQNQPDVMYWPGSNATLGFQNLWTDLQVGTSSISDRAFGPEITFGRDMADANPDTPIAIIKYAVASSGIARSSDYTDYINELNYDDYGNNWHPPEVGKPTGFLYTNLLSNVSDALNSLTSQGESYRLAGLLWMQGEHEAGLSPSMAADYEGLLTGFISNLRQDLGVPDLPVVVGQISNRWIYGNAVKAAQQSVCDADINTKMVVTADIHRPAPGDPHYSANGMTVLGSRFADPENVPITSPFHVPASITASSSYGVNLAWDPDNLHNDLSLTASTDMAVVPKAGDGEYLWVSDIRVLEDVTITFDFGTDVGMSDFVLWSYVSDFPNDLDRGIREFTISFATDSEGDSGFSTSIADTGLFTAAISVDELSDPEESGIYGQVFDFTDVTARYLRVNIANNHNDHLFIGANEMRVSRTSTSNIPGDANGDGKVDGSDVTILADNWQTGVGGVGGAIWAMGDFNGDGQVDGSDVTILADNWQFGVTANSAIVPEPSTVILLLFGLMGLGLVIRRRK